MRRNDRSALRHPHPAAPSGVSVGEAIEPQLDGWTAQQLGGSPTLPVRRPTPCPSPVGLYRSNARLRAGCARSSSGFGLGAVCLLRSTRLPCPGRRIRLLFSTLSRTKRTAFAGVLAVGDVPATPLEVNGWSPQHARHMLALARGTGGQSCRRE